MGKCPQCGSYNSMVEEVIHDEPPAKGTAVRGLTGRSAPRAISDISSDAEDRINLPIGEFARVLGGGIVPGSIVLVGGDPGIGKCVTGDTRVLEPATGDFLSIREWAQGQHRVLALDEESLALQSVPISAFFNRGRRPIVQIETELGRILRCTPEHPLLTPDGWAPANSFRPGDRIAAPRSLPHFGKQSLPEAEIKLIAYILSDGSAQSSISVTNSLPEVAQDMEEIASAFGMRVVSYEKRNNKAVQHRFVTRKGQRNTARSEIASALRTVQKQRQISWAEWARLAGVSYALLSVWRRGEAAPCADHLQRLAQAVDLSIEELASEARSQAEKTTPIARYLEEVGLRYTKAANKAIPACIFRLPRNELALFLKTLFTCDGSVYANQHGQPGVSYSTISRRLAEDVQHILLRFGISAKLRTKQIQVREKPYFAYEVTFLGVPQVQHFLREIGISGRENSCHRIREMRIPVLPSTQRDTIPTGANFWNLLQSVNPDLSLKQISRLAGTSFHPERSNGPLSRYTVTKLANTYTLPHLRALAFGDVAWDTIKSVIPVGEAEVFDLSVPEKHNFVANDLIIHNSTLTLQMALEMANKQRVLYVSGEESERQIKMRAVRLHGKKELPKNLLLVTETNLEIILNHISEVKPDLLIVDSIQTVYLSNMDSSAGSVSQVRECSSQLRELAKTSGISVFVIGHVTKEGTIAGPRVLEHIVDTVLYLEGDRFQAYRLLRSVKNRFGATSEVGVFEMREGGLAEVTNPSEAFLAERMINAAGSAIAVTMEGTRPILVEVQGLTSPTQFGNARRTANGVDFNRLLLITAVLTRRVGLKLSEQDVFVNVVGGLQIDEPAADLALAAAITSSWRDIPVKADSVLIAEIGLAGELRMPSQLQARLREAQKLGFKTAIVPKALRKAEPYPQGIEIIEVRSIQQALDAALHLPKELPQGRKVV
jgi:DNA repair protein RadA/Sms